jgi:hypothetical protein
MSVEGIICQACGKPTPKRGRGNQKYCVPCSEEKDLERGRLWQRKQPYDPVKNAAAIKRREARLRVAGRALTTTPDIAWPASVEPDLAWVVRVAVPFSYGYSKNAIWRHGTKGHVFLGREAKALREYLAGEIRSALGDRCLVHNRVWIDIHVAKSDHKGDAVNVVDTVCDAIKSVCGLDDRWYSIRRLDWSVSKTEPTLFVGLGQEHVLDSQVCSYCGRILPLEMFGKSKGSRTGRVRGCLECNRANDSMRREERRAR